MTNYESASRVENELEHGRKLASEGAEQVWNWSSPAGRRRADRRAKLLVDVGRITSVDRVLEIGCGTGLFSRKVHDLAGAKIVATDVSDDLLQIARRETVSKDITYKNEDAMKMSFAEGEFDVVFGSSILHHLDFRPALAEIYRVLKPSGRIVFAEPNMLNPQILIQKNIPFVKKMLGDSPDETAIVRWGFGKLLRRIGFRNVRIFPYDFLHPATPEFLVSTVDAISRIVDKIPVIREIAGSVIIYGQK